MSGEGGILDIRARIAVLEASGGVSSVDWVDVTGKPATFAPEAHTHAYSSLTGLPALFSGAYGDLTGIPSTFAPAAHGHAQADVTGLVAALAEKQAALVSGSTIKTLNGESLLGSGDVVVSGGGGGAYSPVIGWAF